MAVKMGSKKEIKMEVQMVDLRETMKVEMMVKSTD